MSLFKKKIKPLKFSDYRIEHAKTIENEFNSPYRINEVCSSLGCYRSYLRVWGIYSDDLDCFFTDLYYTLDPAMQISYDEKSKLELNKVVDSKVKSYLK